MKRKQHTGDFEPVLGAVQWGPRALRRVISEYARDVRKAGQHRRQADAQAHEGDISLDLDGIVFHLTVLRPMTFTFRAPGHTAPQ